MSDFDDTDDDLEERMEVKVCGRILGTASGWDQVTDEMVFFYDFEPGEGIDLPAGGVGFDVIEGVISFYENETGEPVGETLDLVTTLAAIPPLA